MAAARRTSGSTATRPWARWPGPRTRPRASRRAPSSSLPCRPRTTAPSPPRKNGRSSTVGPGAARPSATMARARTTAARRTAGPLMVALPTAVSSSRDRAFRGPRGVLRAGSQASAPGRKHPCACPLDSASLFIQTPGSQFPATRGDGPRAQDWMSNSTERSNTMRKLMVAAMAVAGLGLAAGCKSNVERQRESVAEAQRDVSQEQQKMNQDVAETRQDNAQEVAEVRQEGQQDVNEARQDLLDEQRDLAEAENKRFDEQREATGGSGMGTAKTEEGKGTIQSASNNSLTLIIPNQDNRVMSFKADPQLKVMHDKQAMSLSNLKAGDEVRASYQLDQSGERMLRSVEVTKPSAQHPDMVK